VGVVGVDRRDAESTAEVCVCVVKTVRVHACMRACVHGVIGENVGEDEEMRGEGGEDGQTRSAV
jgi:hypothetical protein